MPTLRHQIRIHAPIGRVWEVVGGDLTAVRHYNQTVASVRIITEECHGIGATRHCDLSPSGFVEERVWDWQPPYTIGLEVAASTWPVTFMKWRADLTSEGESTVMSQELAYNVKFGPLGVFMDMLMMRRKLDKSIGEVFANLKRHVESGRG